MYSVVCAAKKQKENAQMKKITLLAVSTLLLLTACGQVESDPPEIAPPATVIQEQPQEQKAPQAETVPRATQNLEPVEEPTEDIPSETVHAKTGYVEPEPEPTPEPTVPADRQVASTRPTPTRCCSTASPQTAA